MTLYETLEALVVEHGLEALDEAWSAVRRAHKDRFCGNCGGILREGQIHSYFSMGGCMIDRVGGPPG